jgi:hypothetical protein
MRFNVVLVLLSLREGSSVSEAGTSSGDEEEFIVTSEVMLKLPIYQMLRKLPINNDSTKMFPTIGSVKQPTQSTSIAKMENKTNYELVCRSVSRIYVEYSTFVWLTATNFVRYYEDNQFRMITFGTNF